MKHSPFVLVVLVLASAVAWAGEDHLFPGITKSGQVMPPEEPLASLLKDFRSRLGAVISNGVTAEVKALYLTDDVTAQELDLEVPRWERMMRQEMKTPRLFFKELSRLPPESYRHWSAHARRLTRHEVTHFAMVRCGDALLIVPLVVVDGKLLIVPSEKLTGEVSESGGKQDGGRP